MKFWLVSIDKGGINGKALMYGYEGALIEYMKKVSGGYIWEYYEVSESNANMLSRFMPTNMIPNL